MAYKSHFSTFDFKQEAVNTHCKVRAEINVAGGGRELREEDVKFQSLLNCIIKQKLKHF